MSHFNLSAEIDRYAYTNSLSKNSPITKLLLALSLLFISVLSPSPVVPIAVFLTSSSMILFCAKIPWRFYLRLLWYPTVIVALTCVIIALFFGYKEPLAEVNLLGFKWIIFRDGVATGVTTFFRVAGALSSQFFLVLTTPMTSILIVLRKARIPKIIVEMSLLIYRYIFVFIEVMETMHTAQELRLGYSGWLRKLRSTAMLIGNLFIRTLEQGERTFIAMSARGYDGNIRVLEDLPRPSYAALLGITLFAVALAITAYLTMHIGIV
ncbi:MAG: cobalt ECF transporter T component CbiQ [Candidatus Bathyarchaeia archaeon]|jgi:cobalt/nickel transport system permease protein